jgi:hypothetical protein
MTHGHPGRLSRRCRITPCLAVETRAFYCFSNGIYCWYSFGTDVR